MANELVAQFNQLKTAVDHGKQEYAAAQRELELNSDLYAQKLGEMTEKFGCSTIEELRVKSMELESKIGSTIGKINDILADVDEKNKEKESL